MFSPETAALLREHYGIGPYTPAFNQEAADAYRKRLRVKEVTRWVVVDENDTIQSDICGDVRFALDREEAERELEYLVREKGIYVPPKPLPKPKGEFVEFFRADIESGSGFRTE
jgi:hypothetical protein